MAGRPRHDAGNHTAFNLSGLAAYPGGSAFLDTRVREALADRHPRPLIDVIDDIGAALAMQTQPMTD